MFANFPRYGSQGKRIIIWTTLCILGSLVMGSYLLGLIIRLFLFLMVLLAILYLNLLKIKYIKKCFVPTASTFRIYNEFLVIFGNRLKLILVKSCQKCPIDMISTLKKLNPWKIIKLMFAYVLIYSQRDSLEKCISSYNLWHASVENFYKKQSKIG